MTKRNWHVFKIIMSAEWSLLEIALWTLSKDEGRLSGRRHTHCSFNAVISFFRFIVHHQIFDGTLGNAPRSRAKSSVKFYSIHGWPWFENEPSVVVARHIVVSEDGTTSSRNYRRSNNALVDSQQEEQNENEAGNSEEWIIPQRLSEWDLLCVLVWEPLPSSSCRANGNEDENEAPSHRGWAQVTYHFRQPTLKGLEIFSLLEWHGEERHVGDSGLRRVGDTPVEESGHRHDVRDATEDRRVKILSQCCVVILI